MSKRRKERTKVKSGTVHVLKRSPQAPARVLEGHVQDLKTGRYRQTKSQGLLQNYADEKQIGEDHLRAGNWYWERAMVLRLSDTGRDSSDIDAKLSGGGKARMPLNAYQGLCLRELISVESHLSVDDRYIIREVCGKEREATHVMRERFPREKSKHYPIPRLREALTKLNTAISNARVGRFKFHLKVVN